MQTTDDIHEEEGAPKGDPATDKNRARREMREAFFAANIPGTYHDEGATFAKFKCANAPDFVQWVKEGDMAAFAAQGGVVTITFDDNGGLAAAYLIARNLMLAGIAVKAAPLTTIAQMLDSHKFAEFVEDQRVLVIPGFVASHYKQPFTEDALNRMEWVLRRWLLDGKALVVQGDNPLRAARYWSPSFITFLTNRTLKGFTV